jgi:thiamine pyrophosphokinase
MGLGFVGKNYLYNPMKKWCWIILLFTLLGSCLDEPDCFLSADTALVINFKKITNGKADTTLVFNKVVALGTDSVFYQQQPDKTDTLKSITLAVNPFASEILFTFYVVPEESVEQEVTLRVGYKKRTRFISEECGSEELVYDLQILETQFDSLRVVNNRLTKNRPTNLEIFF